MVDFQMSRDGYGGYVPDLDNLCEPVFSDLVNGRGWFGKRRDTR